MDVENSIVRQNEEDNIFGDIRKLIVATEFIPLLILKC